jgi:hypothetical protein
MNHRSLCAVALAAFFVAAGGCDKDEHPDDHPHGEGADHSHGEDNARPNPPTRTETVPAAKAGEPDEPAETDPVAGDEVAGADEGDTGAGAPRDDQENSGHTHDKQSDHEHGDHTH